MVGLSLTFEVKGLDKVISVFDQLGSAQFDELMKIVAETLYRQTMQHFAGKYGPDGAWAELSAATIAGVMGNPGRTPGTQLIDSGALMGSFEQDSGALEARVGTNLFYAVFHQEGTGPTGPGHIFSGIPARKMVGLAAGEEDEIGRAVEGYFERLLGG